MFPATVWRKLYVSIKINVKKHTLQMPLCLKCLNDLHFPHIHVAGVAFLLIVR